MPPSDGFHTRKGETKHLPPETPTEMAVFSPGALVLLAVAGDPQMSYIEIAKATGMNERSARRRMDVLVASRYVTRVRANRRNRYTILLDAPLGALAPSATVGDLLALLTHPEQRD